MTIRVLLVDDHAVMREGLHALLAASAGISVVGDVGNGREALRRTVELKPDVVVMDIAMPDLNGIEAAAMIHERCPDTRIVILSMHSSSEHLYRAFAAGASAYVLKSSAGAEVTRAVLAVHGGRRYVSPALREAYEAQGPARASPLGSLSARERQVLQLVVEGKSSAEIAALVHLSRKTVETYRSRIMKKLGVNDVPSLVKFALLQGITPVA
ncbi:MAG TPA: response regulator transcription factor [Burkholderiales bacterium]|nr:response regulator transcription factor [Burkholderiales bacterium]